MKIASPIGNRDSKNLFPEYSPAKDARKKNKILGLDSIRFVCAIWVTLSHAGSPPLLNWLGHTTPWGWFLHGSYGVAFNGAAAVIVFFVISGFCIHFPYANGTLPKLTHYYWKRYIRIGIPVAVSILLCSILHYPISFFNDAILWSLVAEIIYYTLYPMLLKLRHRFGGDRVLVASFIGACCVILYKPNAGNFHDYGDHLNWLLGLPVWLLGCKLAEQCSHNAQVVSGKIIFQWRFLIFLTSALLNALHFHTQFHHSLTLMPFCVLVYFWLKNEIFYFKHTRPPTVLEWAGKSSYSLYLVHSFIPHFLAPFTLAGVSFPNQLLNWTILYIVILAASYAFYLLVETPSHALAKLFG